VNYCCDFGTARVIHRPFLKAIDYIAGVTKKALTHKAMAALFVAELAVSRLNEALG
jgi:hypothetical protein